jgi:hypothetical protein
MRILKDLIGKMDDTLDEIEFYATHAHVLRATNKDLADTYIKVGEMHIEIYRMLHDRVVEIIDAERKSGREPPKGMVEIWQFEHERLVKEFSSAKYSIDDYKKSY